MAKTKTYEIDESILPNFGRYMLLHEKIVNAHLEGFFKTVREMAADVKPATQEQVNPAYNAVMQNYLLAMGSLPAMLPSKIPPSMIILPMHHVLSDPTISAAVREQRIREVARLSASKLDIWHIPLQQVDAESLAEVCDVESRLAGVFLHTLNAVKVRANASFNLLTAIFALASDEKFAEWQKLSAAVELEIISFFGSKSVDYQGDYTANDFYDHLIEAIQS